MGEVVQGGIPESDPIRAAPKPKDQFSKLPGDGLSRLLRGRLLKGDFSLGMGRGDPFQDGALVRVILGWLGLEIVQKNR